MAEFNVGDRVRLIDSVGGDAEVGDLGTVLKAAAGEWLVQFDGRREGARRDGKHLVWDGDIELVHSKVQVGDTVSVTLTGVARISNDYGLTFTRTTDTSDTFFVARGEAAIEVIKKAEPTYTPGKLYKDAEGDVYYRTDEPGWFWLHTEGYYAFGAVPVEPLYEVEVLTKQ